MLVKHASEGVIYQSELPDAWRVNPHAPEVFVAKQFGKKHESQSNQVQSLRAGAYHLMLL